MRPFSSEEARRPLFPAQPSYATSHENPSDRHFAPYAEPADGLFPSIRCPRRRLRNAGHGTVAFPDRRKKHARPCIFRSLGKPCSPINAPAALLSSRNPLIPRSGSGGLLPRTARQRSPAPTGQPVRRPPGFPTRRHSPPSRRHTNIPAPHSLPRCLRARRGNHSPRWG